MIIEGLELFDFQHKIINSIINDDYFIYVLNFGRQTSKSTICKQICLYWGFNQPNSKILFFVPYYKLGKTHFRDLMLGLKDIPNIEFNKTDLEINFKHNNSQIKFLSIENELGLRGQSATHVICDEFGMYNDNIYPEIIQPMLLTHGKKVIFASTPKGTNLFKYYYELGLEDNKQVKSFKYTIYDNPFVTPEQIEEIKKTTPEYIFSQEYLAEFLSDKQSVFKNININNNPDKTNRYFAGIDVGLNVDSTVITILNDKGEMVDFGRWNQISFDLLKKNLLNKLQKWNPQTIAEINYEGGFVEDLKKEYNKIEYFRTTQQNKNSLIEDLIIGFENEKVFILDEPVYIKELNNFGFEWNKNTRTIKYSGRNNSHDDTVISLALAYKSLKENKNKGKYNLI